MPKVKQRPKAPVKSKPSTGKPSAPNPPKKKKKK